MKNIVLWLISFYQRYISPLFHGSCRFHPSCSEYGKQCFQKYGFFHAFYKTLYRILRCNPLNPGGYDPVK